MGRRALRKIDPALDFSAQFRALEEIFPPLSPDQLFGRAAPLEVEMGSGKGLFLETAASTQPAHNFLGIEVSGKYARYAAARLAKRGCDHAIVIHGDGLRLFHEYLPAASAAAAHVYFPDPWWKKRHHKRRIMTPAFLTDVQRVLQPGGMLHFWTDVEDYFHASLELLERMPAMASGPLSRGASFPAGSGSDRTHFERRTRLEGRPVFRAEFVKQ